MATLRTLYTLYAAGLIGFAVAALAIVLFSRSRSIARRAAGAGWLLVLGALWPLAVLTSGGRRRAMTILRDHL